MINRIKLRSLKQGPDQPVKQHIGPLKQIARTCQFLTACSSGICDQKTDYSDKMVLDQLVQGLNDDEIQKKVLAYKEDQFNLKNIKKLVTTKECSKATQKDSKARDYMSYLAPASTYKKEKRYKPKTAGNGCSHCGKDDHEFAKHYRENRSKCPAYGKTCSKFNWKNHYSTVCRSKRWENREDTGSKEE